MTHLAVQTVLASIACVLIPTSLVAGQDESTPPKRLTPPDREQIYEDPDRPLDERVDPSKITELNPPALPDFVLLPMPASFRLAERPEDVPIDADRFTRAMESITGGLAYLRTQQGDGGGWMDDAAAAPTGEPDRVSPISVAVTAMGAKAFLQSGHAPNDDDHLRSALQFILDAQRDDGSFEDGPLSNYVTSVAVSALAAIDDPIARDSIDRGVVWLKGNQWDQSEGVSPRQDWFGGAGYGNRGRPDLSNTQMMLEALYDAGLSPDDPAFQRTLAFLQRTQNLKQVNDAEWAGDDGGFVYTPANGGESMASEYAGEGRHGEMIPEGNARSLRSYGSMTYAGFKSMLYAGMSQDDLRVRAAFNWIRNHWTFAENPGVGQQGLYYYYHTMARALRIAQQDTIVDAAGVEHDWRAEMIDAILSRQRENGSWVNESDRWLEGEPTMATIYAVLALQEILK